MPDKGPDELSKEEQDEYGRKMAIIVAYFVTQFQHMVAGHEKFQLPFICYALEVVKQGALLTMSDEDRHMYDLLGQLLHANVFVTKEPSDGMEIYIQRMEDEDDES